MLRFTIVVATFVFSNVSALADWATLYSSEHRIVEIAVDFKITKIESLSNGDIQLDAKASELGKEIGFSALISKPTEGTQASTGTPKEIPILRSGIKITSLGPQTVALTRMLNEQLHEASEKTGNLNVVGLYSAELPRYFANSFSDVTLVYAGGVGLTLDDSGQPVSGDEFGLMLIIDAPMEHLTVHFVYLGYFGGISDNTRVRNAWMKAITNRANQSSDPTTRSDTPPAGQESRHP